MDPMLEKQMLQSASKRVNQGEALNKVLSKYPGFSKVFNPENTAVVFAPPERASQNQKYGGGGGLEYWPPDETGSKQFSRPSGYENKHVIEIYDPKLHNDPEKLMAAIHGDLLHGMTADPNFSKLREEFIKNYPPQVAAYNAKLAKERGLSQQSIDDMYIRGRLAANQGEEWNDPSRYSAAQLKILEKMKNYIASSGGASGSW